MMDHIRQFDWCSNEPDRHFVTEKELDNCVTEKILRNKFYDPLACTSSEDEAKCDIDWDTVFVKKKDNEKSQRIFVPGLHPVPPYPRKSTLTQQQHFQCLKVLCHLNPHILPNYFIPRPTKSDHKMFEDIKELYEKEQKEYIEWAKTLWNNSHCIRALRPKPIIETVYEAEFKMRSQEVQSFPKTWHVAAQIPLEMKSGQFEMVLQEDLIKVNISDLPQIQYPEVIKERLSIMRPPSIPEPCTKHPCRFVLPGETSVTILPLSEIHRILCQYASDYGAQYVASENALRCLLDTDRTWTLPISVCETIGPDGENNNVIVLGSEFAVHKEPSRIRTYRAYRHLLEYAFIPPKEKAKIIDRNNESVNETEDKDPSLSKFMDSDDLSSEDEENSLIIDPDYVLPMDEDTCDQENVMASPSKKICPNTQEKEDNTPKERDKRLTRSSDISDIGIYTCSCKDTIFEKPPPRSFRKWIVRNKSDNESYDLIVHCAHKTKNELDEEVVLEPTVEYQIDLGVSQPSQSKIRAMALSLMLRQNATVLNVLVDGGNGDVVTCEPVTAASARVRTAPAHPAHPAHPAPLAHVLHAALAQLRGLLPGHYVLHHEARHGANALLLSTRAPAQGGCDLASLAEMCADEAQGVRAAPTLQPALLPYHKFRRTLPCAFTPYDDQVAKEPKKPVTRQRTPPQAIKLEAGAQSGAHRKWPKRKRKNGKR